MIDCDSDNSEHSVDIDYRFPSNTENVNKRLTDRRKNIFQPKKQRRVSPSELKPEKVQKKLIKKRYCCFFYF